MLAVVVIATLGFALAVTLGLPVPRPGVVSTTGSFLLGVAITSGTLAVVALASIATLRPGSRDSTSARWGGAFATILLVVVGINLAGTWTMRRVGESYTGMPEIDGPWAAGAVLIAAVVVAPVAEEWFFREVVLVRCFPDGPTPLALAVSSIGFGALHLGSGGPVLIATLTALGFALGWLRLRTGSIGPPIVVHGAQNLVALGLLGLEWWAG